MNRLKPILAIIFLIIGLFCAVYTFILANKDSIGVEHTYNREQPYVGSGVDSSNDGVAVGLGIISGFSFLSSTLLLISMDKHK